MLYCIVRTGFVAIFAGFASGARDFAAVLREIDQGHRIEEPEPAPQ
jgi:hypothetical protein